MIYPKFIDNNATIGVIAPSSGAYKDTKKNKFKNAKCNLERLGYNVVLSKNIIFVKVEVQIRTMAMDFWSSLEHKMKYKTNKEITKRISKEWIAYAKMVNKIDNKIMNIE